MLEYLPWSAQELQKCMFDYSEKRFSILDIELGGGCNYNCVYCDSPDRNKKCSLSLDDIERLLSVGSFRWVYICGLGEPTFSDNYKLLLSLLELCEKYNVRCSIFTNLSNLSDELKEYIKKGILYILFKFDTRSTQIVKSLYGTLKPEEQLRAIEELWSLVKIEDGCTNIAASIVPTQWNIGEVLDIVKECVCHDVFPLLGELELSGKGEMNYNNLFLNTDELASIKQQIDEILGEDYYIPFCPAVINGIHISNRSDITVDYFSGLSCHWFWLKEPCTETLLHLDSSTTLDLITTKILSYRQDRLDEVADFVKTHTHVGGAFGGCGGDVNGLFRGYLESMGVQNDLP